MLYRYCAMIILHSGRAWSMFDLHDNGAHGTALGACDETLVEPGNYIILDQGGQPITIELTTENPPRRVCTQDYHTRSEWQSERDQLQRHFRNSLRARDGQCAITGPSIIMSRDEPFTAMDAVHIFPTSLIQEWNQTGYRDWITDTSPASSIGESRLCSPQNGLLLSRTMHGYFVHFKLGVDPDADYKIIIFEGDNAGLGGTRLKDSARYGTSPDNRVSAQALRWHLKMCVYNVFRANSESGTVWEEDLGSDDMGEILEQPDAADRMEVELSTRLGAQMA
ncbi:uncharacterized protein N7459_000430 [Penicillium hispanicum]|uniref:uncharacterized protein n=1 Tax=Penicillium hispanicum TaxID=1080232 RepID=UPI002541A1C8|nr:uncharacterized protein N7459_000430 [Penicillium hispanicum]KAJ5594222.1 hypothetical protein N7459_000430 [Penicillium hispanicum]